MSGDLAPATAHMERETEIPMTPRKRLIVLADYYTSGVWLEKPTHGFREVMISHEALAVPAELAAAFDLWVHEYDEHRTWTAADTEVHNHDGRRLARRLKGHVKTDFEVVFRPSRWPSGCSVDEVIDLV